MRLEKPAFKIAIIFVLFFLIVVSLSMVLGYQTAGGFLAPLVLLLITAWLYKRDGKGLSRLGLTFNKRHVTLLFAGLAMGVIFYAVGMYVVVLYKGLQISL